MEKRVVAYCRVSSDHDDQLNSLSNQKQYWEEYIKNRPDMEFCGLYVDEGISGTSTLNRDGFNQMIRDAEQGRFNLVLTKEVSRFGRNIVDVINYTRYLKAKKVGVYFESDSIDTLGNDGELKLSLMSTLAQEESRRTSERVKWGHKRAMKNGIVFGADRIFGYNLENKKLTVNKDEVEVVKGIFNWFLSGESLHNIADRLNEMGIKGRMGGKFDHTRVRSILENEKYCGDLIQRKYYTEDYLTHKQLKNKGEIDNIIIRDNHEAIVDRETWNRVQIKLAENRRKFREEGIGYSRHVWGGKLVCSCCGSKFRRKMLKNKDGSDRPVWLCTAYHNKGKAVCQNGSYIREELLELIIMDIFKQMVIDNNSKKTIIENLTAALNKRIQGANAEKEADNIKRQLSQIQNKKSKLLDLYMDESSSLSKDGFNSKNDELTKMESDLNLKLTELENKSLILQDKKAKLEKLCEMLSKGIEFNEFNKDLVEQYLEKIIVHKDKLQIYLLTGEYGVDLSRYPKRVDTRDYAPIMDTTHEFSKWGFGYLETYKIEVLFYA